MDANDGCFGPTDKSRERSRAPCPPALVLHAERKSAAGDAEDKVGGCEVHNPQLGGPHSLPPVSHLPLGGDALQSPLWYRATARGTAAEPSGRGGVWEPSRSSLAFPSVSSPEPTGRLCSEGLGW